MKKGGFMRRSISTAVFVICFALTGTGQIIENIQFTDMEGNNYDLYEVLGSGKHVYVEMVYNG